MSKKAGFVTAFMSALLLCGAYPPYYLGYFAFVGLVPLFTIIRRCSLRHVLLWTWVNGVFFLGFSLFTFFALFFFDGIYTFTIK